MSRKVARTCCSTHNDNCRFGRPHVWSSPWFGGPNSGIGVGEPGWHESMLCAECLGVCTAGMDESAGGAR